MALIDHPTLKYRGDFGEEACQVVQCDMEGCRALAPNGQDMHSAVDKARSNGFITIRGLTAVSPRLWSCPACNRKRALSQ